jgi:hypothetical protein
MVLKFLICLIVLSATAYAKQCPFGPIKIAVLDTGFGYHDRGHEALLCRYGHKDFTSERQFATTFDVKMPVPLDNHGHGTNIVGLIEEYASKYGKDFCFVIIKYYSPDASGYVNLLNSRAALEYALNIKVDIINYSGGGAMSDQGEKAFVKKFLDTGGKFIAAAGNDGKNIDVPKFSYFPAQYDSRITVVGNGLSSYSRESSSNYGKAVTRWEDGKDKVGYGVMMTGTSQATAVATGKIVGKMLQQRCDR